MNAATDHVQVDLFTDSTPLQISKETREEYVRTNGDYCQFCKSPEVHQDGMYHAVYEDDGGNRRVQCSVVCESCGKQWFDVYSISDVIARVVC